MSKAELKQIVDGATMEEREFLFVCLSEKLRPHTPEQLDELDRRMDEMDAGKKRVSLTDFERRLESGGRS